jgi:rod shape determining protein RodA
MRTLFRKLGQVGWSFPIILTLLALCIASIFAITSATYGNGDLRDAPGTQSKYIVAGFVVYLAVALTPYQIFVRMAPILYAAGVVLLVACFIPHIGRTGHGANSWIRIGKLGFEPAEFAKIAFILGLAWFLRVRENKIQSFNTVLMACAFTAIPFILVLKQPALGTASVFFPVCFAMLFVAGTRVHYLLMLMAPVVLGTVVAYYWIHVWDKPVPFLKEFQVFRIKVFFDPSLDPKGVGYQADQAMIAIGAGGMNGMGWRQGVETALGFLPKAATYNDLIFPVVGEDFGFRGGALLIIFEGIVLLWCLFVAASSRDVVHAYLREYRHEHPTGADHRNSAAVR